VSNENVLMGNENSLKFRTQNMMKMKFLQSHAEIQVEEKGVMAS
jgi:hypothetical protein